MILLIDNYDSFTYNLYQYLCELGAAVRVRRNDAVTPASVGRMAPERIVISPGPGHPTDAGACLDIIRAFAETIPILGVCLGHQALAHAFGGRVRRAKRPFHGKTSDIYHDGKGLYRRLPNPFEATRYHSLIVERESLPPCFEITAEIADGTVMGIRHKRYPAEGVQFHPESIMTSEGKRMLRNFIEARS